MEQFFIDFIAWCNRRQVAYGSELGDLKARAEAFLEAKRELGRCKNLGPNADMTSIDGQPVQR
jgi:hypothetical protein